MNHLWYMDVITPDQMNRIDSNSVELGIPRLLLMENAGKSVADYIRSKLKNIAGKKMLIFAGTGNNGGDGFVAARHLAGYKARVIVILLGNRSKTYEAELNLKGLENMSKSIKLQRIENSFFNDDILKEISEAEIIVDAIFGTGIRGRIHEPYSRAIDLINNSNSYIISVDIPSGMDPLTGEVNEKSVKAKTTVTFHKPKTGLLKNKDYVGEVIVMSIGIPPEAEDGV